VSFSSQVSGGTPPYSYSWTFGEGSSSGDHNPTHTYSGTGDFQATLTVTDSSGERASDSKTIIVRIQCPALESLDVSQLQNFGGLSDYWHYIYAQGGLVPYFVDDLVDLKLSDDKMVSSVHIRLTGTSTDTSTLDKMGQNDYQRILQYYPMAKDDATNLMLFFVGLW
jgi:PKD repeat protein